MTDRRSFLQAIAAVPALRIPAPDGPPAIDARATALYAQPDGRNNLVRISVTGLSAPAARARVSDRHGHLVGTAGLLPAGDGTALAGEVWVPLSEAGDFDIDVEVGKSRKAHRRVHLTPPRRWTLYWLATNHTDVGYTDLQERCLEIHRENLDAALARLAEHPDFRWSAECALQVLSYAENRPPASVAALVQAIRDGRIGFQALFANMLTGLLDHETAARLVWPAGVFARAQGLGFVSAQITDVPGQALTFPMILAASGVRYLASGPNPERALPLLPDAEARRNGLVGTWTPYPQLCWWEAPDGSRVLHWRNYHYGDGLRFGFDAGPAEMARRLSDWLLGDPALLSPDWPYDIALLYGMQWDNARASEPMIANMEEFNRRYTYPRIVPGRAEDFFREVEQRYGGRIPVRRGDTGLYWEDGAASTAAELALFRRAQLALRAAEVLALWDERSEPTDDGRAARIAGRADERRAAWRDALLFGEHTWGAAESVSDPHSRQTVEQWAYKRRFLTGAAAAADAQVGAALARLGAGQDRGRGRVVFNASSWVRSDVARIPSGAGTSLAFGGQELPTVDLADGAERVKPGTWSGLNQPVFVTGGDRTALWTEWDRRDLANTPVLDAQQATLLHARRERLPGIGVRLVADRALAGFTSVQSTVTLYDALPWVDIENVFIKKETAGREALYVAFPFALANPTVEIEVPLGRMTVERDQQPGSCRDWYCHEHWVWLHDAAGGVLWSGPDTPLLTLNDIFRGQWRRQIAPDGTLFAYAMNNYWGTNYAAGQSGEFRCRFRLSLLAPGDPAEPVRRGWAACDPLYVSAAYDNRAGGALIARDAALSIPDPGVLAVGVKPADDGEGVVVKLLDVTGVGRTVGVWPAAYGFASARQVNLVEMNADPIAVGSDRRAALDLRGWGVAAARLFTPRAPTG